MYEFKSHRTKLIQWADKMESMTVDAEEKEPHSPPSQGLKWYWGKANRKSLDGLPGLVVALDAPGTFPRNAVVFNNDKEEKTKEAKAPVGVIHHRGDVSFAVGFTLGVLSMFVIGRRFYL